jgi:phytoene dehydrogenase-like protein
VSGRAYDAIVIGAGHNGLVAAAYLARAGRRVLVLERRSIIGGATVTEEKYPGFKFTIFSYVCSLMRPEIIRELNLPAYGFDVIPQETSFIPLPRGTGPPGGDYMYWRGDDDFVFREISRFSKRDAEAYPKFGQELVRMARVIHPLLGQTPPDLASLNPLQLRRLWAFKKHFDKLTEDDLYEFARIMTMSSSDYLDEWFEDPIVKGALASSSIIGTMLGPKSPGTAYVLMHHVMGEIDGSVRSWGYMRGGMGTVANTIAAAGRDFGVEIRTDAEVRRILVTDGRARGVELANGEKIPARVVLSNADPKRTFLRLCERNDLPSSFVHAIEHFRIEGSSGKVNLALDRPPEFPVLPGNGPHLQGAMSCGGTIDYMEHAYDDAKHGGFSKRPYIDFCIPSTLDPTLAPGGKHVLSMFVQYAPYHLKNGGWTDETREAFGETVLDTLEEHSPTIRDRILYKQVLSPKDMEDIAGLTFGNIFHGELTPDQLFFLRPVPRWSNYRSPIKGLYLCGSGAHPGGGVMGAPGRNCAVEVLKDFAWRRV